MSRSRNITTPPSLITLSLCRLPLRPNRSKCCLRHITAARAWRGLALALLAPLRPQQQMWSPPKPPPLPANVLCITIRIRSYCLFIAFQLNFDQKFERLEKWFEVGRITVTAHERQHSTAKAEHDPAPAYKSALGCGERGHGGIVVMVVSLFDSRISSDLDRARKKFHKSRDPKFFLKFHKSRDPKFFLKSRVFPGINRQKFAS
jgi:hypothetical protein